MRGQMTHAEHRLLRALRQARLQAPPALPSHSLDVAVGQVLRQFYESGGARVPTEQEIITIAGEIKPGSSTGNGLGGP